jgi:hypothetical protein
MFREASRLAKEQERDKRENGQTIGSANLKM